MSTTSRPEIEKRLVKKLVLRPAINKSVLCRKKKRLGDVPIECKQRCFNDTSAPFQTTDNAILTKTIITYPDGKNRWFQVAWYKQYSWVVLCEMKAKAFCFYCRFATSHAMMVFSSKAEDAFVTEGFCNWKHAKDKFNNHEKSQAHSEACLKFSTFTQPNIIERMNVQLLEDQEWHRKSFLILLTSLQYLLRHDIHFHF